MSNRPNRVIFITDKPSKALPVEIWIDPRIEYLKECKIPANAAAIVAYACYSRGWQDADETPEINQELWRKAVLCKLVSDRSTTQKSLTDYGHEILSPITKQENVNI